MMNKFWVFVVFYSVLSISCYAQNSSAADLVFGNTMVNMTWQQVQAAAQKKAIVLVPIAVVEEHGPHMNLSPDILGTSVACSLAKDYLEKENVTAVISPPYYWGINEATGSFPGSFSLKSETMKLVLSEIIENMRIWGFEKFYILNFHGDPKHQSTIAGLISELKTKGVKIVDIGSLPEPPNPPAWPTPPTGMYSPDYHAGASETSMMFDIAPNIVDTTLVRTLAPQNTFKPLGYVGDPANYLRSPAKESNKVIGEYIAKKIINAMKIDGFSGGK